MIKGNPNLKANCDTDIFIPSQTACTYAYLLLESPEFKTVRNNSFIS